MASQKYFDAKKKVLGSVRCKKGKECGEICIPKRYKCNKDLNLKQTQQQNNSALPIVGGILAGVAGVGVTTAAVGAGSILAAKLVTDKVRADYHANFLVSAEKAKQQSQNIHSPKLTPDQKNIVFAVGGWGTEDAFSESEKLQRQLSSLGMPGLYIEPQPYQNFNVSSGIDTPESKRKAAKQAVNLFLDTAVKKKHNAEAVNLAAKVMAYKRDYPDREVMLFGHSGGGLLSLETHEILNKAGIKVKTTAIGSPDLIGLLPGTGDAITTVTKNDDIVNTFGGKAVNPRYFNNVQGHGINAYFSDNDFRDFMRERIRSKRLDSAKKAKCKDGEPCGEICIPKESECSKDNTSIQNSPIKSSNNTALNAGITLGASLVGLPMAGYAIQVARFKANFPKSVEMAKAQAKDYNVPTTLKAGLRSIDEQMPNNPDKSGIKSQYTNKEPEQITFFVGGIGGRFGLEADHMGLQVAKMLPDHHVVGIEAPEQDVSAKPGDSVANPNYLKRAVSALLKDNLTKGRSEIAVRMAARAYAYHQKHPDKPINLMGQSGGGMPVREAAELLDRMGVKDVRVATAGTPYFGLTPPKGLSLIDPDSDPVDKVYGITMPNRTKVKALGHSRYFSNKDYGSIKPLTNQSIWDNSPVNTSTQATLNNYFKRTQPQRQLVKVDSKVKGKKCGKGYIPAKFKCRLKEAKSNFIDRRNNAYSPGEKDIVKALKSPIIGGILTTKVLSTIAVTGLPLAVGIAAKKRYQQGFEKSAQLALKQANEIDPKSLKDFKDKKQITFVQTGFANAGGPDRQKVGNERFFAEAQNMLPDHGIVGRYNKKFNVGQVFPDPPEGMSPDDPEYLEVKVTPPAIAKFGSEALKQTLGKYFVKGYNPESVDLAAEVYAYHKKYPKKPINIIGHSAGSMISRESGVILKRLGVDVKIATIGGPDYEVAEYENTKAYLSKNDPVTGKLLNRKAKFVNEIKSHSAEAYLKNPTIRGEITEYFNGNSSRKDSETKGIKCGKGYISAKLKCRYGKGEVVKLKQNTQVNQALKSPTLLTASIPILSSIAVAGLPVATLALVKNRYRQGLDKSAQLATQKANAIDPKTLRDIGSKKQITFVQTGFTGVSGKKREKVGAERFFGNVEEMLPDHAVIGRENKEFNIPQVFPDPPEDMSIDDPRFLEPPTNAKMNATFAAQAVKKTVGAYFVTGHNPEAINLAAEAYAYHKKYPDRKVNIIGHSAGAMIGQEAGAILKKMGVEPKVVTLGGPDYGVVEYPKTKAYLSKNDPVTGKLANKNAEFFNDIKSHKSDAYLKHPQVRKGIVEYLNSDVKQDSVDITKPLERQLTLFISRSYGKPIMRVGNLQITNSGVTGLAQDFKGKVLSFTYKDDQLSYEANKTGKRLDAKVRRSPKKKECKKGIACGSTCISSQDTCKIKLSQLASPSEMNIFKQTLAKVQLQQNAAINPPENKPKEDYITNPETGQPYTIRELRKVAAKKQIYGYGSMTMNEMREALKLNDLNPESNTKIAKGILNRKGLSARAVEAAGLSGRNQKEKAAKAALKDTFSTWKKLEMLAKFAGASPVQWSAAAVGAFLFGASIRTYERARQKYRDGFTESARIAEERAMKLNISHPRERNGETILYNGKPRNTPSIREENITFTVGTGKGYGAEEMKRLLQREKNPDNDKDYWFSHNNKVIPFNMQEFGADPEPGGKEASVPNIAITGIGGLVKNFARGRNQDAVDLAATIYAHANALSQIDSRTLTNRHKKINILAHQAGGLATKEALEILARMEVPGMPTGKKVLERVNVVYLGTPHLGFAENVSSRQRTIVSSKDPISTLPAFGKGSSPQWISSVKGHTSKDYLEDERVRDSIREAFGYYKNSPDEMIRQKRIERSRSRGDSIQYSISKNLTQLDAIQCKTGVPCGNICLPRGDKCRIGEYQRERLKAKFGQGKLAKSLGGIAKDLERTYLKARKSMQSKKDQTILQKAKNRLIYEAKLVGVSAGQGGISRKVRQLDKKLIDAKEAKNNATSQAKRAIAEKLGKGK